MKKYMFPERLKNTRIQKNLTQTELGKLVGIHYSHISKYEKGHSRPNSDTLKKLAEALEVTTDYMLEGQINEVAQERLEDQQLLKLFKEVEKFSEKNKNIVKELIKAFIAKNKMEEILED